MTFKNTFLSCFLFLLPFLNIPAAQEVTISPSDTNPYSLLIDDKFENLKTFGSGKGSPGYMDIMPNGYWFLGGKYNIPYLSCSDFIMECDIYMDGAGECGVIFRKNIYEDNFYSFQLSPSSIPRYFKAFGQDQNFPVGLYSGTPVPVKEWIHLKISAEKDHFDAFINGNKIASYDDAGYQKGGVAFFTRQCHCRIRNLKFYVRKGSGYSYDTEKINQVLSVENLPPEQNQPFMGYSWKQGQWISVGKHDGKSFIRKQIRLDKKLVKAWLDIACDGNYILYVNGRKTGSGGRWYNGDAYDISDALAVGDNQIMLQIEKKDDSAMLAVGEIILEDGKKISISSRESWEASLDKINWRKAFSLGFHPTQKYYYLYNISYRGGKSDAKIKTTTIPSEIPITNQLLRFQITFDCRSTVRYPFKLEAKLTDRNNVVYPMEIYDKDEINKWIISPENCTRNYELGMSYENLYLLKPGKYNLKINIIGDACHLPSVFQKEVKLVEKTENAHGPDIKHDTKDKIYTDQDGGKHSYRVEKNFVFYDETPFVIMKNSDGACFVKYQPEIWAEEIYDQMRDDSAAMNIVRYGLNYKPVRCELADYVDCSMETHGFSEDGGIGGESRVMNIDGVKYRVTAPSLSNPSYFYYSLNFKRKEYPHIIAYQVPNDMPRPMTVNPVPTESGSGGISNGMIYPLDNKSYYQMYVYYPPLERVQLCFMSPNKNGCLKTIIPRDLAAGAAVSKIYSLYIIDSMKTGITDKSEQNRKLGIYYTEPLFIHKIYGIDASGAKNTSLRRRAAYESFLDYMKFSGCNLVQINFLGGDWVGSCSARYNSQLFPRTLESPDFFEELVPAAAERNMKIIPFIAPFQLESTLISANSLLTKKYGICNDSFLLNWQGKICRSFGQKKFDPLRPEVQKLFLDTLTELAEKSSKFKCIEEIGTRVTGFGLGFPGGEEVGYSKWDIDQFSKETGIKIPVPDDSRESYEWIRKNCRDKWIAWRCEKIAAFWKKARDIVAAKKPGLKLVIQVLTRDTSISFLQKKIPDYKMRLAELKGWGFDPKLFRDEKDIVFQPEWIEEHRYLKAGIKDTRLDYDPEMSKLFATKELKGFSVWTGYWEQAGFFHSICINTPGWLASASVFPIGRNFFDWIAYSFKIHNPQIISLQNWERGIATQEMNFRRFGRAFISLAAVPPQDFNGTLRVLSNSLKKDDISVKWFGDSLCILNTSAVSGIIELSLDRKLKPDEYLRETGWGWTFSNGEKLKFELQPFDLMVLEIREK